MINPRDFYELLNSKGLDFFTGVPDSLLKDFNAYVIDNASKKNHIIVANEGGAIGLAAGYYLATGKIPLVYMQNSGLGNAINPLTSLTDKEVYSIPMLLLIGWRGHSEEKDEPQHKKIGKINPSLLESLEIPYSILSAESDYAGIINKAVKHATENSEPYAILVRKDAFEKYELHNKDYDKYELTRENAIKIIIEQLDERDIIVSTTGMASRELYEYRRNSGQKHDGDFLTVGSMGHSSQIALGIALSKPERNVFIFDGDGAAIMHLGGLAIIGQKKPKNFKHIILNNGAHDSVGGQPTAGFDLDFLNIAKACGYASAWRAETADEIKEKMSVLIKSDGPSLLEIKMNKGHREDLGRPATTPIENKNDFMENLRK